ncbi:peptide ABC transporter permease [Mesorhizobium tianshanense]|uniref:Peptide/nickel transport system permease protein n=1 Tax=Mesorhizobium tianshanense TaxID=39844 RepID=A0A562MCJ7_9HYPH|nr:ABC transporter permease [Mesorhizobium tianshanense]TWI17271.1 peptide/nickel transport system permease protein [Mesorhizobium tianshanense]GLS35553.1 peptide ABC transporter permease [Mesorhizobium tianshanense]
MGVLYLAKRLGWMLFILFGSTVVIFLVIHVIPGDPARAMLGPQGTPEAVETLRRELGLNDPLWQQYLIWVGRALTGNLGHSILLSKSVLELLGERVTTTLLLSLYALILAVLIALPISVMSATRRNTIGDHVGRLVVLIGLAMPSFWFGLMLMLLFSVRLGWLPVFGYVSPLDDLGQHFSHMVLPAVALGSGYAAMIMETTRNSLVDVLNQDYIRTARAGGLAERLVLWKYAMRNALIPTVTVIGIQIGYLMSGAIVIENLFAIPGIGRLMVNAVLSRDYPVVQGTMLTVVFVFAFANLCVDLLCAAIDPRTARE